MTTSTDQYWKEAMDNTASFNSRLLLDRKMRMPFLDAQTGMAQINCSLWIKAYDRGPGKSPGQLYTYPAKRWRKKKRPPAPVVEQTEAVKDDLLETGESDLHQISAVENPLMLKEDDLNRDAVTVERAVNKDYWYDDVEDISEPPDAGEIEDFSDVSDYEETYRKKRKKAAKGGRGRGKKVYATREKSGEEETEKPFPCELCSARYKTRPGLTYHYTHFHDGYSEEPRPSSVSPKPLSSVDATPPPNDKNSGPNDYCDFCLGDAGFNKKTKSSEELVSCADCGRSGHPTCLQFTENMIVSVKKYPWQCIECKSCLICRTSENDDQLLFCDDCDRGYHMYCLSPPLSEPPEGNWSCNLCIKEFHNGKKPEYMEK